MGRAGLLKDHREESVQDRTRNLFFPTTHSCHPLRTGLETASKPHPLRAVTPKTDDSLEPQDWVWEEELKKENEK